MGEHPENSGPLFILATIKLLTTSNSVHNLGLGLAYQRFDENWQGSGLGEHPNKFGTPYLFLQPLKPATSNLGQAYQKKRLGPKLVGVWARRVSKKIGTPYLFLQL